MDAAVARSGGFGGGVEWAGGQWRADRRLVVAARSASVVESLVEHYLRSVVKIRAHRCMAGDRRGGSVMREGWAEIWMDRCLASA